MPMGCQNVDPVFQELWQSSSRISKSNDKEEAYMALGQK